MAFLSEVLPRNEDRIRFWLAEHSLAFISQARRKPRLLFRLSGVFLFRLAERQFWALLFQLPPRLTRFEPLLRTEPFL